MGQYPDEVSLADVGRKGAEAPAVVDAVEVAVVDEAVPVVEVSLDVLDEVVVVVT